MSFEDFTLRDVVPSVHRGGGLHPGGLSPGGLPRGVCLRGGGLPGGGSAWGVCIQGEVCLRLGGLPRREGVHIQGGLPGGGSASMGSAYGGLHRGGGWADPLLRYYEIWSTSRRYASY